MIKYKIFNPLIGAHSANLFLSEVNLMRDDILKQIRIANTIISVNKPYKKLFSDLLLAANYFASYNKKPLVTKEDLVRQLNTGFSDVDYYNSILNLDTGESVRFFSFNTSTEPLIVKIKNSVVTDFYINSEQNQYPWKQFNPTTMELEAYYEIVIENGVEIEKKFLATGELDSMATRQGYEQLPDDFKSLVESYPQVPKQTIEYWARKSYGRTIAFTEDLNKLPDDPLAIDVKDEVITYNERAIQEIASTISVVQVSFDEQGNEIWSPYNP